MKVVIGLLVLLTIAMLVGVVRKLRGDTFLPGPGRAVNCSAPLLYLRNTKPPFKKDTRV
jgi:hypothetical protein